MVKNEVMTTKELAQYIQINEKTVIKMAQKGELPGVKIGNKWRFQLASVDKYLQNGLMKSLDRDLDLVIDTAEEIIPLSRLTNENLIHLNSQAKDKNDLLYELTTIAYETELTATFNPLYQELQKRERMLSTAVGMGVAMPHPRNPSPGLFKKPNLIVVRSKEGIRFNAPDKKTVKLFFMSCAPNDYVHLRLMAKISKLFHIKDNRNKFLEAENEKDLIKILLRFDQDQLFPIRKKQ